MKFIYVCIFRRELISHARLIIWDEVLSSNKEVLDAVARATNDFYGKVVLMLTDYRQSLPVVKNGTKFEVMAATIVNHRLFPRIRHLYLNTNMRLASASLENRLYLEMISSIASNGESFLNKVILCDVNSDPDSMFHVLSSKLSCFFDFSEIGESIGRNEDVVIEGVDDHDDDCFGLDVDDENDVEKLNVFLDTTAAERAKFVTEEFINSHNQKALIELMFPGKVFDSSVAANISILAVSNKEVDEWNALIGELNPNAEVSLESNDYFTEV